MHRRPIALSWSGGKDSALALHTLLRDRSVDVASLVTTVTSEYDRVSMHGVRTALLEEQAMVLGLPLHVVRIPLQVVAQELDRAIDVPLVRQLHGLLGRSIPLRRDYRRRRETRRTRCEEGSEQTTSDQPIPEPAHEG